MWCAGGQVGAVPFEGGLRGVTWHAVVAAVTLTALTTVCSAWRWRVVARALGVGIGLRGAACAYYRSLFLNSLLVGGDLGARHRGGAHRQRARDQAPGRPAGAWGRRRGPGTSAV